MPAIVPSIANARVAARKAPGLFPFADRLVEIDVPNIGLADIPLRDQRGPVEKRKNLRRRSEIEATIGS